VQIVAKPDDLFQGRHHLATEILAYFILKDGSFAELSKGEYTRKCPIWIVTIQKPHDNEPPPPKPETTVKIFGDLGPALKKLQDMS
jgi:hypothetical protein